MSKHTPGPWTLGNGEVRIRTEKNEQGRSILVAECYTTGNAGRYPKYEERKANARLIAAAPELLEALKKLLEAYKHDTSILSNLFIQIAQEAITKAEGEAQ